MARQTNRTTRICGYDADRITVRGKNLVTQIMGKMSFTQMILLQLLGKPPSRMQTKILDAVLVTIMEHGLVPSAVVSRLTLYGAPDSVQGAVAAGILGVGDRYAGTASGCAAILEELVKSPRKRRAARARAILASFRDRKAHVPGFGHPIHRGGDPRVARLLDITTSAGADGEYLHALSVLERTVRKEMNPGLVTNVSAALAAAMGEAGIPPEAMRGIILTARCAGVAGHVFEEMRSPIADAMWHAAEKEIDYRK